MNYRGFGLAWLAVWLFAAPAGAVPLTVGALGLDAAEVWQRGSAQEETDFDSVILRMGNGPDMLEVFLPRHRARPKTAEAQFIEQLEASWRRRYGQEVAMDWLEVAGKRWRVCRRPSQGGDGHVFQIVTVHAGEAYQMVAVTPVGVDRLPLAVQALLGSAAWDGVVAKAAGVPVVTPAAKPVVPVKPEPAAKPEAEPVRTATVAKPALEAKPAPQTKPEAKPEAKPEPPATPVAAAPPVPEKAAPVAGKWRFMRGVTVLPQGKDWGDLADAEGRLLGTDGPVTGLGLAVQGAGLDGFLEGYLWHKGEDGRERRQAFRRHWQVRWPSLPDLLVGGQALALDLDFLAEVTGLDAPGNMSVRLELIPACAPRKDMISWLDGLEANGAASLAKLDKMVCQVPAGGPAAVTVDVAAKDYPTAIGGKVSKRVLLAMPVEWESGIQAKEGEVRRLVLVARFQTSGAGNASGDPMFRQAAAVFVFGH